MFYDQSEFDIRCEWGLRGAAVLGPLSDVVIIVDVLSFSTCVDIAVGRGATVYPYRWGVEGAAEYAASMKAVLADPKREKGKYSLSPESLLRMQPGEKIVIPSPNGATLALTAKPTPVLAGCLRNARSVAAAAMGYGTRIAVIPAGERWKDDQSLRPAFEDLVGAGAIISQLRGRLSPEARAALAAFEAAKPQLAELLDQCSSGKELI
ncbi:MAG TPA: 2-phosphosulfolactate phosphatase, partial [Anaerolineales bacterium]|nr:2-phosphosulfolactate phosphatase [Anaerolineales bacterium]